MGEREGMTALRSHSDPVSKAIGSSLRRMLRVVLFSGLVNLLTLSGSIYMLQVYDRVIPSRDGGTLAGLSVIVLLAYVLQGFLDALRSRLLCRIAAQFDVELQGPLYRALAGLPLTGARPAELQQPLRDLDQVRSFLAGAGPTAFLDMPWIPLFLLVLYLFHPLLGATAVLGAGTIILLAWFAERRSSSHSLETATSLGRRGVLADAARTNAEVIRVLGMTSRLGARWAKLNENVLTGTIQSMDFHANLGASGKVLRYMLQSAMLGLGAYLVISDQASGGIMIASSIIMGRTLAPIEIALSTWRQLAAARAGISRLRVGLAAFDGWDVKPAPRPRPSHQLMARNVAVIAPGTEKSIVTGVSFNLAAGTGLALIGPSGSGKSSLVRALTGAWPLAAGEIRLDGVGLAEWDTDALGQHLGYLPQEVGLFDGTIAENIARFDPNARPVDVVEAAQIAGAHELILGLAAGYHTRIGQGGSMLSAGQRQRIGLARAAYGNPFLVVLDEPNANLDASGDAALTRAILTLKQRGSAVVVVSHRASALEVLDTVMVLVGGRMLTIGTRAQVQRVLSGQNESQAATLQ